MRIGVIIRAYGLTDFLKPCIRQYAWTDHILVMNYRFKNVAERRDDTKKICEELALPNLSVNEGAGLEMHEVLNMGLKQLSDYDFVFVVDSDEFITQADQKEIVDRLSKNEGADCAQIAMYDYSKDFDHIFLVRTHKPPTLCRPKKMSFYEARNLQGRGVIYADIFLHHLGYLFKREDMDWKYNWERPVDKWALEIEAQRDMEGHLPDEIRELIGVEYANR